MSMSHPSMGGVPSRPLFPSASQVMLTGACVVCAHVCQLYSLSFKRHPFLAVTCVMSALLVQGVNGVRGADEARIPFL